MLRTPPRLARIFALIGLLALLLGSCASSRSNTSYEADFGAGAPMEEAPAPEAVEAEKGFTSSMGRDLAQAAERLVIKNASLTIVAVDPSQSMDRIASMAEELGGFVVSANLSYTRTDSGAEVPRASVTVRVPAERLDEALSRIQAESDRDPLNKNIQSEDVTSQYTDLQSRLRNLEAAEDQLTEIMESANRTEDVLNVYAELTEVRGEIEVLKGQIQYYEQAAALSSISAEILANEAVQPLTIGGWEPVGVAKDALQALIGALKFLANAAIWIVLFLLPVALLVILPVYVLIRIVRRWVIRRRRTSPPAQPAS